MERLAVMPKRLGFTLIELLVVLAILVILAGILFPVFASARDSARQTMCISNFRQVNLATTLYYSDYDERTVPASYTAQEVGTSTTDRTWVQLVLPYVRSFGVFKCPGDHGVKPNEQATFDEDLVAGDAYSRYYRASQRSNIGYNYVYLSPMARLGNGRWSPFTRSASTVSDPSRAFVYVDSVWEIDSSGRPSGGGSYLVVPPCRYTSDGIGRYDTFMMPALNDSQVYKANAGWLPSEGNRPAKYGGVYPWHRGRATVAFADGSVRSLTLSGLTRGCDVRPDWGGTIFDLVSYGWDMN
ncbi:MAG: type II secretion system GspH family protein [Fimbriimonadaceae bacterium]|nr:type II secretion system GspH family protein [Fimbriimonadaceae bacterium]